jgi:deazaflavin-dependent oxidoreductase (nitroreductase family)
MSEASPPRDDAARGGATAAGEALRRMAGAKTMRLTVRGRKTGLPRTVTIWFVADGDAIGLGTLNEERNWVRNARRAGEVEVEAGGVRLRGRFADVDDPQTHERVRAAMARKYWAAWIASLFGIGQKRTFRVDRLEVVQ